MRTILITGGTGLIGSAFINANPRLSFIILSRQTPSVLKSNFHSQVTIINSLDDIQNDAEIDAAINLAGEPIAAKSWSDSYKKTIYDSRIQTTHALAALSKRLKTPLKVCISGSAVGVYGDQKSEVIAENGELGGDFAAKLCIDWESAASHITCDRLVIMRTGLVLEAGQGLLRELAPSFKFGLGAVLGTGQHYMPWVHIRDMSKILLFLLNTESAHGAFNACAPAPASNREFSKAFAKSLGRPCFLRLPSIVVKLIFGERSTLLLGSQRTVPDKLQKLGYRFIYEDLSNALVDLA